MEALVNSNCIGCGLCANMCPQVFSMTDEGVARGGPVSHGLEDPVKEAAESCPVSAIELD